MDLGRADGGTPRRNLKERLIGLLGLIVPRNERVVQFLLTLVGVDRRSLDEAPRSEQVVYLALGMLMCVAAFSTGAGLSYKVGAAFGLGLPGHAAVLIVAMTFSLLLEVVVLGTLRMAAKSVWSIALRLLLGVSLMSVQVVTVLVIMFQPLIDAYQNDVVLVGCGAWVLRRSGDTIDRRGHAIRLLRPASGRRGGDAGSAGACGFLSAGRGEAE